MRYVQSAPVSEYDGRGLFYTNRCGTKKSPGCNRALTKLEVMESFGVSPKRDSVCPCGSNSFRVSNFKWWEELLLFRSWKMWLYIIMGWVTPPPTAKEVADNQVAVIRSMIELERGGEEFGMVGEHR